MLREKIDSKYKWNTTDLYATDTAWENAFHAIQDKLDFAEFQGKLIDEVQISRLFMRQEDVLLQLERLFLYAHLKHDENAKIATYTAMYSKAMSIYVKYATNTAFVLPELTALPIEMLQSLQNSPLLKEYNYFFKQLIEQKQYVLSADQEKILAMTGDIFSQFKNIFSMIDNADMQFGKILDKNGELISLTHGSYNTLMHEEDRETRRKAFKKYYAAYIHLSNSIAATYYGNVQKNVFSCKVRGYENCLQKALIAEDVPVSVYSNLLEAVHEALHTMHQYIAFRKKVLQVKNLHFYDIYAPLVAEANISLPYEEGYQLVKKGLEPLGKEYISLLEEAFTHGWIDVYESTGKRSGAYSSGIYGMHPYVLLNYHNSINDVFTVAHEMGHALHTYYANNTQPYVKADYRIFVAEVASTVNEVLLLKYLIQNTTDVSMQKYYYNYYLDMIRATLFRQALFAEFEECAHTQVMAGIPITVENMNEHYLNLNKMYYGNAIVYDKEIAYEWLRIPHFYNAFYVYKYATGLISAITIANKILQDGSQVVEKYKDFLKAGGSASPVDLLKIVDVDLTTLSPFQAAMQEFETALQKLEGLF